MKYFKAELFLSTELFVNNDQEMGCDPETWSECGMIESMTASSLPELISKLKKTYAVDSFEKLDGHLEFSCVEIERDNTPYVATYSIYISEVEERDVDISEVA